MTEEQRRQNFRKLWKDLGPKMAAKNVGRDQEAEDLFLLGWALGAQDGVQVGVDHATSVIHNIRTGNNIRRCGECDEPTGLCECN